MTLPQGKTIHELNSLALTELQDADELLVGDVSEPLKAKRTTIGNLRVMLGTFAESGNVENPEIEFPSWILEGMTGFWRINILSSVTNALAYLVWYYDDVAEAWVQHPVALMETRTAPGLSGGPLVLDIYVVKDAVTGIAERTYRRFKIQVITSLEKTPLSTEQAAYSLVLLPADFVPDAPIIEDSDEYPYTETLPKYMTYGHSVVLKFTAPTGQAGYVDHYELQRRKYLEGQGPKAGWQTLPMHMLTLDPQKPAPTRIIYVDDSAAAAPGDVLQYRVRAVSMVDTMPKPGAWSTTVTYTVEEDATAPDPPVLSVYAVQLGLHIIIATPTQNDGDACSDVQGFIIYGRKGSDAYANILGMNADGSDRMLTNYETVYKVPDASLASQYQFKAIAVDWSGNMSDWSTATSATAAAPITMSGVDTAFSQKLAVIDSTASTVSTHTTQINQNAYDITLKAASTTVSAIDGRLTSAEAAIIVNANAITLKANSTTVSAIDGRLTSAEGSISVQAGQ
ncbi:MAG: hypothetical protein KBA51_09885, partial [Kiritimatiellae bacterium]|nr:hypothetical protein [Kiritimatiellia bacterium]